MHLSAIVAASLPVPRTCVRPREGRFWQRQAYVLLVRRLVVPPPTQPAHLEPVRVEHVAAHVVPACAGQLVEAALPIGAVGVDVVAGQARVPGRHAGAHWSSWWSSAARR